MPAPPTRKVDPVNPDGIEEETEGRPRRERDREHKHEPRSPRNISHHFDDRVIRLATTKYPWRALGAMLPPADDTPENDTSNCSGVLIGPRHVLTAGHCLFNAGAWIPNARFAPGMKGVGTFPNGVKGHAWYYIPNAWYALEWPTSDYGLLILQDESSTAHLGWFGFKTGGHAGGNWTFGYPNWQGTCAASPVVGGVCFNFLYGSSGQTKHLGTSFLTHGHFLQPGQSGSPVYKWKNGKRYVIAVNYAVDDQAPVFAPKGFAARITNGRFDALCTWMGFHPSAFNDHGCT